jgi:hypothetical protein
MAFVPTEWTTAAGARTLEGLPDPQAVRETLGGRQHDKRLADLAARLRRLNATLEASERLARPVRRMLQSGTLAGRERVRADMCFYYEPDPDREKENRLCRSINLLSDGSVYASLEDHRSLLYRQI